MAPLMSVRPTAGCACRPTFIFPRAHFPTLTHFAEFQLLHTPAAFQAERIAWRTVIYLNLVRSVRRCCLFLSPSRRVHSQSLTANRILDTISAERDEDTLDNASIISDRHTASSVPSTDSETHRIAAEKHAEYSAMLAPVLELEGRLIRRLREDDDEDEATHLGDGSTPGWATPRGEYAIRPTNNWKRAFSIRRSRAAKRSTSASWSEDPADPVHVLDGSREAMLRLWGDEWVRRRLIEKRVRLQESSGLYVRTLSYAHVTMLTTVQLSRPNRPYHSKRFFTNRWCVD
jgi:hypothetical protein